MIIHSKDNSLDRLKVKLTKVFIDLSEIVHGVGVGELEPGKKRGRYIRLETEAEGEGDFKTACCAPWIATIMQTIS